MKETEPKIRPAGDSCLVVDFGNAIALEINAKVQALRSSLEAHPVPGIMELMPTYRSLAVYFDPVETNLEGLRAAISAEIGSIDEQVEIGSKEAVIPVC